MRAIEPTAAEVAASLPGDGIVPGADVVMDRAFTLPGEPATVWPWFVQLGKNRSGWYLPRSVERFFPPKRRALRTVDPALQTLHIGEIIDDWGGPSGYFELAAIDPPSTLVHKSTRGTTEISWSINLRSEGGATRVHIRLRMASGRKRWLRTFVAEWIDALTIAGLAAGLRERLS